MPYIPYEARADYDKWAKVNEKPFVDKSGWVAESYWADYLRKKESN